MVERGNGRREVEVELGVEVKVEERVEGKVEVERFPVIRYGVRPAPGVGRLVVLVRLVRRKGSKPVVGEDVDGAVAVVVVKRYGTSPPVEVVLVVDGSNVGEDVGVAVVVVDIRCGTSPDVAEEVVGVVEAGKRVGEDDGGDVVVKRCGTSPVVAEEVVGVVEGGKRVGEDVGGSTGGSCALHLQYFLGGLVGAGTSGASVGLLGGAKVMRTGVLNGCSTSVVSVTGFSTFAVLVTGFSVVTMTGLSASVVSVTGL